METYGLPDRFWAKVDRRGDDECWEWRGGKQGRPGFDYGRYYLDGKTVPAHRYMYENVHGPATGLVVRHRCDNPPCVNPGHLQLGTHKDNTRDCVERGRNWHNKITHCPKGHEYAGDNLYEHRGSRQCKACRREADRAYWQSGKKNAKRRENYRNKAKK